MKIVGSVKTGAPSADEIHGVFLEADGSGRGMAS